MELALPGEPLILRHHLLHHSEIRLHNLGRKLLDEAIRKLPVLLDHVLRKLRRAAVTREELVERPACPLLALCPGVLLPRVLILREQRGVDRVRNDGEQERAPGDERVVCLVSGREGVDDAVLVRLEDEAQEGALRREGGGFGGRRGEDLLADREKEGKEVCRELGKSLARLILVSVSVRSVTVSPLSTCSRDPITGRKRTASS